MAETTQYGAAMSWKEYVDRLAATRTNTEIARMAGVTLGNVTKWRKGTQNADAGTVIRLAREAGDDPLGVLVALGYLTAAEANSRPAPSPDYSQISNRALLELVRSRMREDSESVDEAPKPRAGGSPALGEAKDGAGFESPDGPPAAGASTPDPHARGQGGPA